MTDVEGLYFHRPPLALHLGLGPFLRRRAGRHAHHDAHSCAPRRGSVTPARSMCTRAGRSETSPKAVRYAPGRATTQTLGPVAARLPQELTSTATRGSGQAPARPAVRADPDEFRRDLYHHLLYTCVKDPQDAGAVDLYRAMAHSVRDRLVERWLASQRKYVERDVKRINYLSAEFLTGRSLGLCLVNLGSVHTCREARRLDGLRPLRHPRDRGRSRSRQRRPGAAGGVLHGLAGHAGPPGRGLRDPLRARDLRAAHRARPAGRAHRQLAPVREPLGPAAPRPHARRPLLRDRPRRVATPTDASSSTGSTRDRCSASRTTRSSSATRPTP